MDSLQGLFSLNGHVGLVTGASSGLGVECAIALAIGGADLILVARRAERIESLAAELRARYHIQTLSLAADLTLETKLDEVVERGAAELGEIDVLVNNAGRAFTGRAERLARADWDRSMELNVTVPLMLSQRVARRLIARRQPGRIINMSTVYGSRASGVYHMAPYVASKAALTNLTRQLAVEWAPHGITVNALTPGWFPTEGTQGGLEKPGNREKMERFTPMGRLGRPEEIRGAVLFLAGPAGSYVTGAAIAIDGGLTAW